MSRSVDVANGGRVMGRLGGQDRYETAAAIAAEFARTGPAARGAVLASGEDAGQGVDALAGSFLAGHLGVPVLLTRRGDLPDATRAALADLLGSPATGATVHVMGGTAVVADAVLDAVRATGATAVRVSGGDRYGTAAAAARLGASSIASVALLAGAPEARTALLAGGSATADGLSAGPLAFAGRVPLLLTARDELPAVTRDALRDLAIGQVVVLGGTGVVSSRVLDALDALGVRVVSVPGATRYDTAAVLTALASAPQLTGAAGEPDVGGFGLTFADAAQGYLANGVRFPDALTAGPLAGRQLRPLFLTAPAALSPETANVIGAAGVGSLTAVGLGGAVPDAVLAAADAAARG